jgi:hypothetical protein
MLAIFYTEKDAVIFSDKIHKFLKKNRKDYHAEKWAELYKHETEEKWMVKVPSDYQKYPIKMTIDATCKEQIPISSAKEFLSTWKIKEISK